MEWNFHIDDGTAKTEGNKNLTWMYDKLTRSKLFKKNSGVEFSEWPVCFVLFYQPLTSQQDVVTKFTIQFFDEISKILIPKLKNSVNDLWLKSLLSDHLSKIWRMHITGIPSWDGLWTMDLTSSVLEMDWSFIIFDSSYYAHVSLFSSFYSNPKQQTLKSILDLGNHLWRS